MKVYVASSWRNQLQPMVVAALRYDGHEVYDFRNPPSGSGGFHWSEIDPGWQDWTPEQYARALTHPIAKNGFASDMDALRWCDVCVMLQPCGRSAALELGWACGAGKRTVVLLISGEPELMVAMVDLVTCSLEELRQWLQGGNTDG
jgi:hypothetical protein